MFKRRDGPPENDPVQQAAAPARMGVHSAVVATAANHPAANAEAVASLETKQLNVFGDAPSLLLSETQIVVPMT